MDFIFYCCVCYNAGCVSGVVRCVYPWWCDSQIKSKHFTACHIIVVDVVLGEDEDRELGFKLQSLSKWPVVPSLSLWSSFSLRSGPVLWHLLLSPLSLHHLTAGASCEAASASRLGSSWGQSKNIPGVCHYDIIILGPATDHSLTMMYTNILTGERGRGGDNNYQIWGVAMFILICRSMGGQV